MSSIAKGLEKPCPICGTSNTANEAEVQPSGDILYKFLCPPPCDWYYVKKVKAPNVTVEPLIGFKSKPMRWEK